MTILVPLKFQMKLLSQNNNINKQTPVCSLWICSTPCVLERILRVHAGPLEKRHGEERGNLRGPAGDFLHVPGSYSQRAELCCCYWQHLRSDCSPDSQHRCGRLTDTPAFNLVQPGLIVTWTIIINVPIAR